jgi:hypothetical protein
MRSLLSLRGDRLARSGEAPVHVWNNRGKRGGNSGSHLPFEGEHGEAAAAGTDEVRGRDLHQDVEPLAAAVRRRFSRDREAAATGTKEA